MNNASSISRIDDDENMKAKIAEMITQAHEKLMRYSFKS